MRALHTIDYELFFGSRSGSVERCLLAPTDLLLNVLHAHQKTGVLFVDWFFLIRLREQKESLAMRDSDRIQEQLVSAIARGFDLGYHFHPHWLNAAYLSDRNEWIFPTQTHYTLHHCLKTQGEGSPHAQIKEWIEQARELMNALYAQANVAVPPRSIFRAGGWCIEPFFEISTLLEPLGLGFDSSVVPGLKTSDPVQPFDFSNLPLTRSPWKFSRLASVVDDQGPLWEIPVTTFKRASGERWMRPIRQKLTHRYGSFGDGMSLLQSRTPRLLRAAQVLFRPSPALLSLETQATLREGNQWVTQRLKKPSAHSRDLAVTITHPKGLETHPQIQKILSESELVNLPSIGLRELEGHLPS